MNIEGAKENLKQIQFGIYSAARQIGDLIQQDKLIQAGLKKNDLFELADRLGEIQNQMVFSCITVLDPEKLVITNCGEVLTSTTLSVSFTYPQSMDPATRVDLWVSYDQGQTYVDVSTSVPVTDGVISSNVPIPANGQTFIACLRTSLDASTFPDEPNEVCCEFTAASSLGEGVDPSGMNQLVIPATDYDVGEMPFSAAESMLTSAGLSTRFINGWELASTLNLDGKRALGFLQKPTPDYTTDDRFQLMGRFPTGSREARVLQCLYVPTGIDYGPQDSSTSTQGQTAKVGIGLISEVDPTGGNFNPQGTSIRPIWRVLSSNADPEFQGYFYHSNQASSTGDDVPTGIVVPEGRWVTIGIDVLLNSAYALSDGILRMWIDGQLVINETDVRFISQQAPGGPSTPEIGGVTVSLWYGGGVTDAWTPDQEETFYIGELYADQSRW